jgi:apolipoprotein N-acyltransferase
MKRLLTLTGWPRMILLCACGVMAALALAPSFWWPLLPVSYGLWLHYVLRAESARAAFRLSWWWGFGFFLAGLYWICISMTVDLARFGWMIPFALIGLNGGLALFPALAGWVFARLRHAELGSASKPQSQAAPVAWILKRVQDDRVGWVLFALLVAASEWLRGNILTGFPWNLIGYAWGATDASIQIASAVPIYALTFTTILLASSAALWAKRWPVLASVAVFALMLSWSREQLADAQPYVPETSMRLVQANIAQTLKNDPAQARAALEAHVALSQGARADVIIWAESALPYALDPAQPFPSEAFDWLAKGQTLITGGVMIDAGKPYNSIIALTREGIIARYDKQHLVPFGEYVPFRGVLPIEKLTPGMAEFERGKGPRALLGFHPLVCYEVIFPQYSNARHSEPKAKNLEPSNEILRDAQDDAPSILLNITNDGWFGDSSGPYQHLTMARFRAVEQGAPLIRVANSGISALIDAHGRVQHSLLLNEAGVIEIGIRD